MTKRILAIKDNKINNYEVISAIELTKNKVRFSGATNHIEKSKRRRLKYHPRF